MMLKRIIALTIVVLMLLTITPFAMDKIDYSLQDGGEESFNFLKAVGIISENEIYQSQTLVTRAQFVNLAINLAGIGHNPDINLFSNDFVDVPQTHIYAGAVYSAKALGYVSGSGGYFQPDEPIKLIDAAKILTDILGFKNIAISKGGYPSGYAITASSLKLLNGISQNIDANLAYSDAMIIIDNAANTDMVVEASIGDKSSYEVRENVTPLSQHFGIYNEEGIVNADPYTNLLDAASGLGKGKISVNNVILDSSSVDYGELLGLNVKAYYKKDGNKRSIVYVKPLSDNKVTTVELDDLYFDSDKLCYMADTESEKINVQKYASFILNGKMAAMDSTDLTAFKKGYASFIDNNGDNFADVVKVFGYTSGVVTGVNWQDGKVILSTQSNIIKIMELDSDGVNFVADITKNGRKSSLDAIEVGDIVLYTEALGHGLGFKKLLVSDKKLSGVLNEIGNDYILVGSKKYQIENSLLGKLELGSNYKFSLDSMGTIANVEFVRSFVYGYMYDIKQGTMGEYSCLIYSENNRWVELPFAKKIEYNGQNGKTKEYVYNNLLTLNGGQKYKGVVRYLVNKTGELSVLKTPQDLSQHGLPGLLSQEALDAARNDTFRKSFESAANGGTALAPRPCYRPESQSFDGKILLDLSTVIFYIPPDGNKDDITVLGQSSLSANNTQGIGAYDVGENMCAAVITVDVKADTFGGTYRFMVATGIGDILNSEGELVKSVMGYWRGQKIALPVKISDTLTLSKLSEITVGAPLRFALDENGEISKLEIYTAENGIYGAEPSASGSCVSGGRVNRCDTVNGSITVDRNPRSNNHFVTKYDRYTEIMTYDVGTGKAYVSNASEILPTDTIIVNMVKYIADDIIVIRN